MKKYLWLWVGWIAAFLTIEGFALANKKKGDTLSEYVWKAFSIKDKGKAWRLRRFGLLAFLSWLVFHFLSGGTF